MRAPSNESDDQYDGQCDDARADEPEQRSSSVSISESDDERGDERT